jgi:predicted deacylase
MRQDIQRIPIAEFRVADLPPGDKRRLELVVDTLPDGQPLAFAALVVRGREPGPVFLTNASTHGDEYEGIVAIQNVYEELDAETLRGTFFGIPVLNGPAFTAGTREGGLDHLNLARIFPGSAAGSPTQRIAHAFQAYVLPQADFYLDIHSGGNTSAIKELAGYQVRDGNVGETQRAAAIAFGLDLVWGTEPLPGRTLSAAGDLDVPAIYVELRGEGRCRPEDLAKAVQGVRNIMSFLHMIDARAPERPEPLCVETLGEEAGHLQIDYPSPTSGIFVPDVALWDHVAEGQRLGVVRHPNGTVLAEVTVKQAGRVLFLRTFPGVFWGDALG